jgi:plastocyanin
MTDKIGIKFSNFKQFDSGLLNVNQPFEHTFDKAGVFNYFCTVHPTMTGVVNVK